jgi:antitoxin (DNA-binding transcriptional repressor) of toxin-antitoxin stability system
LVIQTINVREAKTHLSRLVEQAAKEKAVIVAKTGKLTDKVAALDTPEPSRMKRIGFLSRSTRPAGRGGIQ